MTGVNCRWLRAPATTEIGSVSELLQADVEPVLNENRRSVAECAGARTSNVREFLTRSPQPGPSLCLSQMV